MLNHKIPVVFYNLKEHDWHLIMEELGKFSIKINVIPNGSEKYANFSINNKWSFNESFQFLSYSLNSLVKNVSKGDFKCLSQEFENNVLDLDKQKDFIVLIIWIILKSLKNNYQAKKGFIVLWSVKTLVTKSMNLFLMFWTNLK